MSLEHVLLPDGRTVEVLVEGPPGRPVVRAFRGTPSTATFWSDWAQPVDELGMTLVAVTRPGYTNSSRHRGRRVVDAAADSMAVLDALGIGRVAALGYSGGCPHALALGASTPERCSRVVAVAGVVPYSAAGVDLLEGMGDENVDEFNAALNGESSLRSWMYRFGMPMLQAGAEEIAEAFGDLVDDSDRAVLAGGWAAELAAEFHRDP